MYETAPTGPRSDCLLKALGWEHQADHVFRSVGTVVVWFAPVIYMLDSVKRVSE